MKNLTIHSEKQKTINLKKINSIKIHLKKLKCDFFFNLFSLIH
jgi:hypothetical protein